MPMGDFVLASLHHQCLLPQSLLKFRSVYFYCKRNVMDIGPNRDILGDLAEAIKAQISPMTQQNLHWGTYHSLFEWFSPSYLADKESGWNETAFRDSKTFPELYDLVNKYAPELIWSDGDWEAPDEYWNGSEFLAWYSTNSSVAETAVWNDRWGQGTGCKHGAFWSCADRYQPGSLQSHKWENALTVDVSSWGFRRNAEYHSYLTSEYFVHELIETVAFGGNMLLNVGPSADGTIDMIFFDRLLEIGSWLRVNGRAIYSTTPWDVAQNETDPGSGSAVFYTVRPKKSVLYAVVLSWPGNMLQLSAPILSSSSTVTMLGVGAVPFTAKSQDDSAEGATGVSIDLAALGPADLPCQSAWAFALTNVLNV